MTRTIIIPADENNELVDKLCELDMIVGAKQNLLAAIIEGHKFDTDSAVIESVPFKEYQKEYENYFLEYKKAQTKVPAEGGLPAWLSQYDYNWRLDTLTREYYIDFIGDTDIPELADYEVTTR